MLLFVNPITNSLILCVLYEAIDFFTKHYRLRKRNQLKEDHRSFVKCSVQNTQTDPTIIMVHYLPITFP